MFNKNKFAEILQEIISQYDSISNFAEKSSLDRTYLSKYINKKLEHPPSPDILRRISDNSNNIIDYLNLMYICNYLNYNEYGYLKNEKLNVNNFKIQDNYSMNFNFTLYNKLNDKGQEKVNDYIKDLVNTKEYNKKTK